MDTEWILFSKCNSSGSLKKMMVGTNENVYQFFHTRHIYSSIFNTAFIHRSFLFLLTLSLPTYHVHIIKSCRHHQRSCRKRRLLMIRYDTIWYDTIRCGWWWCWCWWRRRFVMDCVFGNWIQNDLIIFAMPLSYKRLAFGEIGLSVTTRRNPSVPLHYEQQIIMDLTHTNRFLWRTSIKICSEKQYFCGGHDHTVPTSNGKREPKRQQLGWW